MREVKEISHHASHFLYQVCSTRDAWQWFVDITNAQFGIHETFSGPHEYMKKYGNRIHSIAPLGTAKA
jgi:hypothetical protein